jgi:ABC-type sugar transport system permease subunit
MIGNVYTKSRQMLSRTRNITRTDSVYPYLLILPVVIWLFVVYFYPLVRVVFLSFTDATLANPGEFVGLEQYRQALTGEFVNTIYRTAIWTGFSVFFAMLIGLSGALALRKPFRGRKIVITIALIPWAMPLSITGYIWEMMLMANIGFVNIVLYENLGLISENIIFMGDHPLASVIGVRIWKAFPFALIVYYARLKAIPSELYEAARLDGAGKWMQFRKITLPQLREVTMITLILLTVWTTMLFDIIFVMTGGGPGTSTMIIPVEIYTDAFQNFRIGRASAKAMITVALLMVLTTIYWKIADF